MKRLFFFTASLIVTTHLLAQDNIPYAEKAAQLQKEIWGTTVAEFKQTEIPAAMANESAVVLARSYSSQRTQTGKFKFAIIIAGVATRTTKVNILHERVKINDKKALDAYSTLQYQQKLDQSITFLTAKGIDVHNTFVGAKVVKPNGKETIVNSSEAVLTKNETKDQKGRLAITGLQVGDVLDYYVAKLGVSELLTGNGFSDNDDLFLLADEYPVLYYSIDFMFGKKVGVKYINANGAPPFQVTTNEAGDQILSIKLKNIPKYQAKIWTSNLRQYPYLEVSSSSLKYYLLQDDRKVNKASNMLEGNKAVFESDFAEEPGFDLLEDKLKNFFDKKKALKSASLDSSMKILYDEWKYHTFCFYGVDDLAKLSDLSYRMAISANPTRQMCYILTNMEIDHDLLLVASRYGSSLSNVFGDGSFTTAIRINGPKPLYMFFDDVTVHFNEIPDRFQGERALVLHPKRHSARKYTFEESETVLPVIGPEKNRIEEVLQVNLLGGDNQKLKVDRLVKETGSLRHSDQKLLIPVLDVDNGITALVKGDPLAKRLSSNYQTKKMVDDYNFSFNKELKEINKYFATEIKNKFDQEAQQLSNCKIVNAALENSTPVFTYSASFVLANLVKKAGNNYIIDVGKLTGGFLKLEDNERARKIDVYEPGARSFKYTIAITIPAGYTAKGVEEMAARKMNNTGLFASTAAVNGNILTITVYRVYNHNFEKAADWPLMLELIDAASAFDDQKILLEKNT